MFATKKLTKLTWFDGKIIAEKVSKVVKLILTGGKNENISTTVVVSACYAWILTKLQIYTCQAFPH